MSLTFEENIDLCRTWDPDILHASLHIDFIKRSDTDIWQAKLGFFRAQKVPVLDFAARAARYIVVIIVVVHAPRSERL